MSKKLWAILALVVCMLFVFAACEDGNKAAIDNDTTNAVAEANGGFLTETEKYVYLINGNELYTENNTENEVEKGAIIRLAKDDVAANGLAKAKKELVVSKIVSTTDYSAGMLISGGRIYFATPSNEKNKVGDVQNDVVEFCSAKLDGSDLQIIAKADGTEGNAVKYRFIEEGGKVYVVYASTVEDGDTTATKLFIKGDGYSKELEYSEYVIEEGGSTIYYTAAVKTGEVTESFNQVYRITVGGDEEQIFFGAGSGYKNPEDTSDAKYANKGIQGVKYTLIKAENDYLYLSVANIDTSFSTDTVYAYVKEGDAAFVAGNTEANHLALITDNVLAKGGASAATAFAATSIYLAPDCVVYLDSAKGLCSYNYTKADSYKEYYGLNIEFTSDNVKTATLAYVKGGYLYYHVSGVYYRVEFAYDATAGLTVGTEEQQLSPVTFSTSWYAPEVVAIGGAEYIFGTPSSTDYYDYAFGFEVLTEDELEVKASDVITEAWLQTIGYNKKDAKKAYDELKKDETVWKDFLTSSERAAIKYVWENNAAAIYGAEQADIDEYIDATYPGTKVETSEEEEEGCSSTVSAGLAIGGGFMLIASAFVMKRRG